MEIPAGPPIRTIRVKLPGGREVPLQYPATPLMDAVVKEVLSGSEYPPIPFIDTNGSAIVDIGANVGCSAIIFATQYPQATVYALEPGRETFAFLARNTAPFPSIRNFQIGAFNRDTTARFFLGRAGSVTSSLFAGKEAFDTAGEMVQLRRISSFLKEQSISRISVLKIDTEGSEIAILSDLVDFFPRIDAIHVEFHCEPDRLELDRLLGAHFSLCHGRIVGPHRGILLYIAKGIVATKTSLNQMAINTRDAVG